MRGNKSYEGLSLEGIAGHIINSIFLWKYEKIGTRNDCQLVINRLIRVFHDRLLIEKLISVSWTEEAFESAKAGSKVHKEHAIPVATIMRELIETQCTKTNTDSTVQQLTPKIVDFLKDTAKLVWVSTIENERLTKAELAHCMPKGHENYPWPEPYIRYVITNLSALKNLDR